MEKKPDTETPIGPRADGRTPDPNDPNSRGSTLPPGQGGRDPNRPPGPGGDANAELKRTGQPVVPDKQPPLDNPGGAVTQDNLPDTKKPA